MEHIETSVRVTSLKIQPFAYKDGKGEMIGGESQVVKAEGYWVDKDNNHYPVSLHFTTYPGHPVVPPFGDCLSIVIQRADSIKSSTSDSDVVVEASQL